MQTRKCRPLEPNRPRSPAKMRFGRHPASRSSVKIDTFSAGHWVPVDNETKIERCTVMKQVAVNHSAKIHPRLSVQRGNVRISNPAFINAHPYVLKNHHECRALPRRFGDLSAVYAWFRRGSCSGGLERLLAALREQHAVAEDADCFDHDSTCAKVNPGSTEAQ